MYTLKRQPFTKKWNLTHGDYIGTDMDIYALHLFVCQLLLKWNFSERFNKASSGWIIKWIKSLSDKGKFTEGLVLIILVIHRWVSKEHSSGSKSLLQCFCKIWRLFGAVMAYP